MMLLVAMMASCKKESQSPQSSITYTNALKVYAGSNLSVRIYFTVANASNLKSIIITPVAMNYSLPAVVKDGSQFVQDNIIGSYPNGNFKYVFLTTDVNGVKSISEPFTVSY